MTKRAGPPEIAPVDIELIEEMDAEEAEQAAVGSLFSIQGPGFEDVEWSIHRYRNRQETAQDPSGQKHEWVADITGELHGADLVAQIGGGTFRFIGYRSTDKGKRIVHNRLISLAGPRKNFAWEPPPVAAQPAQNGHQVDPVLAQILAHQQRQLDKIEARLSVPAPAAPGLTLSDVKDILELSKSMQPPQVQPAPQSNTSFKEAMDAITLGANLKESLGLDGGEKSTTEIVIEKALPAVERLATAIMARRAGAPPPRPQAREVRVEEATPPAAAPTPTPEPNPAEDPNAEQAARWSTLISSLARAIADQRDPADFAATAEDILEPDEVKLLAMSSPGEVLSQLVAAAGGRFPVLLTTQAETYVTDVLSELKRVD